MSSRDYWEKRALESHLRAEQQTLRSVRQIEQAYDRATAEIQKDIAYWLSKFADNNQISMTEAKKLLKADELKEFRWTVEEYIRHGENNLDGRWERQLVNASSRVHISRLESLQTQIRQQVEALSGQSQSEIESLLGNLYQNQYYHTAFDIQKGLGIGWDLRKLDDRKVKAVLSRPWAADGKVFSDRIWENKTRLLSELDTAITRTILTGKKWDDAIRNIADRMQVSKNQAARLVMTEAAAIDSVAQGQCYQDLDVEEFENVATLDFKTSEICREMDGKHFPMSEYKIGVTAPPFHPWCRTCTAPYFDDWEELGGTPMRAARDENGQGYELVSADLTYKEWEKRFVKEKTAREEAARPEYEKMLSIGLLRIPSLDQFAAMQYNQTEEYNRLLMRYQNLAAEHEWMAVEFNPETISDHFSRHGEALGAKSQGEYNRLALNFLQSLDDKEMILDSNGVRRVYSETENLFAAVYPDGTVSTFFKPRQGRKYWESQVKKYGEK